MNFHVAQYYMKLMNDVNTGCPMNDYCMKDVFLTEAMREV